jgi:uncharacterized membrane protein/uncharacterized protein YjiS (DUF1127 family)
MFFATTLVTWSFEQVGVLTGVIYGAYHYSGMLGLKLGAVPLLIPFAWFMMIYPSYLVATLILDGKVLPQNTGLKCLCTRAMVAAIVMTAWDVVIDPDMARAGYWVWEHGGSYFGVPRHNFVGWLVTTFAVYLVFGLLQRWLKPVIRQPRDWFGFLPTLTYTTITLVQVANQEVGPSSVIAFFAMGFPALLAIVRWTQDSIEPALSKFDREAEDCLRAGYRLGVERYRQRKQLMEMDDRQLKDIGITPEQAELEAGKPIWRA